MSIHLLLTSYMEKGVRRSKSARRPAPLDVCVCLLSAIFGLDVLGGEDVYQAGTGEPYLLAGLSSSTRRIRAILTIGKVGVLDFCPCFSVRDNISVGLFGIADVLELSSKREEETFEDVSGEEKENSSVSIFFGHGELQNAGCV